MWLAFGLMVAATVGCDSVELTIAVRPAGDGAVDVVNADRREWVDAHLLVEAVESDNSTTRCQEQTVGSWAPGEAVTVPACGAKLRLTVTTGGETARFSYANGQLFRKFGRKEVPVSSS